MASAMARIKKRVGSLQRPTKKFPVCREQIEAKGWVPHILCDRVGIYWDGLSVADKGGHITGPLSDSFRQEMITMILDGLYGDEAKDAVLDEATYWKIRDALITWPNPDRIRDECLNVLSVNLRTESKD